MSQTSGSTPPPDPDGEHEKWLRQFTGLPEGSETDDLHNDLEYVEPLVDPTINTMTPMGLVGAFGEMARESKRQITDETGRTSAPQKTVAGFTLAVLLIPLIAGIVALPFGIWAIFHG